MSKGLEGTKQFTSIGLGKEIIFEKIPQQSKIQDAVYGLIKN